MKTFLTLALAATSSLALSGVALAQAAAPAVQSGPPINGVCVLSAERAVDTSAVGISVSNRLKELGQAVQAEMQPEAVALQQEQATLQAQQSTMPPDQFQARAKAFTARYEQFQRKGQLRQQEMEVTRNKQLQKISAQLDPIVKQVYAQRNCSVLINADMTFGNYYNPAMDLTPAVISGLNGKIQTLSFDREHLDQQVAAAEPVPAAQPAAAPRKKK
jgi:outer membrane protein